MEFQTKTNGNTLKTFHVNRKGKIVCLPLTVINCNQVTVFGMWIWFWRWQHFLRCRLCMGLSHRQKEHRHTSSQRLRSCSAYCTADATKPLLRRRARPWKNDWEKCLQHRTFLLLRRCTVWIHPWYMRLWAYVGVRSVPVGLPGGCGWVWGSRWCPGSRRAGWHRAPGAQTAWRTGRWLSGTPPRRYTVRGEVDVVKQRQRRHQRQEGNVCNVQKWSNQLKKGGAGL